MLNLHYQRTLRSGVVSAARITLHSPTTSTSLLGPTLSRLGENHLKFSYRACSSINACRQIYSFSTAMPNLSGGIGTSKQPYHNSNLTLVRSTLVRSLASQSNWNHQGGVPPPRTPPPRNRITTGLAAVGTGAAILFGKGKYLLGALKLTKFASLGSMIFTVGTYSMFFGFPYAVGAVGLIAVHETGHALVMHRLGIPFSPMVFIPFMGAAVAMQARPKDAYEEALVAFGGPYMGTAGAVGINLAALATGSDLLFALSDFGYMINLFNMLPIGMMDGGRICGALSPYAGVAGLGVGGLMIYNDMIYNPIFYLIMLSGAWSTFSRFYYPNDVPVNYYAISRGQRAWITAGYFGLVMFLFGAMSSNRKKLKPPEVLQRERELKEFHVRFEDGKFE